MPQARSSGSKSTSSRSAPSTSSGKSTSARSGAKRKTGNAAKPASASRARASTAKSTTAKSARSTSAKAAASGPAAQARSAASAAEQRAEAIAQRLRKLNERIIDAGKDAGESTLSSYEKALKAIASTIERGPGSSDIDWISNLATAQAKFIRDVTAAWTKTARDMLPK
jgi:hypothetical protein